MLTSSNYTAIVHTIRRIVKKKENYYHKPTKKINRLIHFSVTTTKKRTTMK